MNIKKSNLIKILTVVYMIIWTVFIMSDYTVYMGRDDIGQLSVPSYLAYLDWKEIIKYTEYYGYGFRWLFTPFFIITKDYKIIMFLIRFLHVILFSLAYFLFLKGIKDDEEFKNKTIVLSAIFYSIPTGIATKDAIYSEYSQLLCLFLLMGAIHKLFIAKGKNKALWSSFIAFWLVYMLTIHEKSLIVIIAFFIVVFLDWIYQKEICISIMPFSVSLALCYTVKKIVTADIQSFFWGANEKLYNTKVTVHNIFWIFDNIDSLKAFVTCFLSNITSEAVLSMGMFIIMIVVSFLILLMILKRSYINRDFYIENRIWIFFLFISVISVLGVILGLAINWGYYSQNAYESTRGIQYYYKGYVYTRYYNLYIYPGMIALLMMWKDMGKFKINIVKISIILFSIISIWFIDFEFPYLKNIENVSNNNYTMERIPFIKNIVGDNTQYAILLCISISLITMIMLARKKYDANCKGLVFIIIILFWDLHCGINFEEGYTSKWDGTYSLINYLDKECQMPTELYCFQGEKEKPSADVCTLQFVLNRHKIIPWCEKINRGLQYNDIDIVLTRSKKTEYAKELLENNFYCYQISDKEFIWINEDSEYVLNDYIESYLKKYGQ